MLIKHEGKSIFVLGIPGMNDQLLHDIRGRVYFLNWSQPENMPSTPGKRRKVKWVKAQMKYSQYDDLLSLRRGLISAVAKSSKRVFQLREVAEVLEKFQDVKFVTHLYEKGPKHQVFIDLRRMDELLSRSNKQPLTEASGQLSAIIAYVDQETSSVNIGVIQCRSVATYERIIEQLKTTNHWRWSYVSLISRIDARVKSYKKLLLTYEQNLEDFLGKYLTSVEAMNPRIIAFVVHRMQKNLEIFQGTLPFKKFCDSAEKLFQKLISESEAYEFHQTKDVVFEIRARIYYEYLRLAIDRMLLLLVDVKPNSESAKVVQNELAILGGKLDSRKFGTVEDDSLPKFSDMVLVLQEAMNTLPVDPNQCKTLLKSIL